MNLNEEQEAAVAKVSLVLNVLETKVARAQKQAAKLIAAIEDGRVALELHPTAIQKANGEATRASQRLGDAFEFLARCHGELVDLCERKGIPLPPHTEGGGGGGKAVELSDHSRHMIAGMQEFRWY